MEKVMYRADQVTKSKKGRKALKRKFVEVDEGSDVEAGEEGLIDLEAELGGALRGAMKGFNPLKGIHHRSGVRVNGRDIYFESDVDEHSVADLKEELNNVAKRLLKKQIDDEADEPLPIRLHIKSYGGALRDGFDAVEYIRNCAVPVHTYVEGFVASSATLMSVVGVKRFMQPTAFMLIHELRSGIWGKMTEIEEHVENLQKYMEMIRTLYVDYTVMSRAKLTDILKKDIYLTADECLKSGLIDEIK